MFKKSHCGCRVSVDLEGSLLVACERGHTESAQLLIDKGEDVNECDQVYTAVNLYIKIN